MTFSYNLRRIKTPGDGSCFLHAVLRAIWTHYKHMDEKMKRDVIKQIRHELSNLIERKDDSGKRVYDKLSRGQLKELSNSFNETKLEEMKRFLKSDEYFTHLYLEFISEAFSIDIYIIDYKSMDLYNVGDVNLLYKGRDSIILGYDESGQHFETLEIEVRPGKYETFFKSDSNVVKEMSMINEK